MSNIICIIQINHTDLENYNLKYNCIEKLRDSDLFDFIVLAAPDINENFILRDYAKEKGLKLFLGDTYNVAKRILDCCERYNSKIAVRVLINWFFIDVPLIKTMVQLLEAHKAEYVNLPREFDIRFGADVFTDDFLRKVIHKSSCKEDIEKRKMLFNPWGYADAYPRRFDIITCQNTPLYSLPYFEKIREIFSKVWIDERLNSAQSPLSSYEFAQTYLDRVGKNCRVLDIACGFGHGTNYLSSHCEYVFGVDIDEHTIREARKRFPKDNIKFEACDASLLRFPNAYLDSVVSVHTMEHLGNDAKFLQQCSNVLRKEGCLIIEVPKLRKLPFENIDKPISKFHVREYSVEGFFSLLNKYFTVEKSFGVSRGFYVSLENARESLMAVCKKKT
jgi:ubiquinone/menaquinone biosynthesis C-methylase UbiE